MRSARFTDHFEHPRNAGELSPPAVVVEAANPVCGDTLRLSARWEQGRIAAAAYKSRGCAAAIACGSALTELLTGRDAAALASLTREEIEDAVGGLPRESHHAVTLCLEAVQALLRTAPVK